MGKLLEFYRTRGWTQGANARDRFGVEVPVNDKDACSFCLYGGMGAAKVTTREMHAVGKAAQDEILRQRPGHQPPDPVNSVMELNDHHFGSKEDVLDFLERHNF
jgi:hypothetical protein